MSTNLTRKEIMKRLEIEDTRITNTDKNIEGLLRQRERCLLEQQRLLNLLAELDKQEAQNTQSVENQSVGEETQPVESQPVTEETEPVT